MFAPDGSLLARYRKIHLFDVSIEGQVSACESRTRQPGTEAVCVDTELGRIGLAVCYDLRFPELFRRLADAGAEVVVMPSAFTAPTGRAHWHALIRARAIENQCYFVAPNQYGPTQHGFDNFGHSIIVDPWGTVVAEAGEREEAVICATMSTTRLEEVRRSLPSLRHRRLAS
jgi:predicted amidohydrolase